MICLKCQLAIKEVGAEHYGLHASCFSEWFGVSNLAEFSSLQRKSNTTSSDGDNYSPENSSFFQGKFKKYSAELNGDAYNTYRSRLFMTMYPI